MKKLWFTGLLAVLAAAALCGWQYWRTGHAEMSNRPAPGPLAAAAAHQPATVKPAGNVASARPPVAPAAAALAQPQRRAWDYNYLASLANAAPGAPIRFELTGGSFAVGAIRHLERTNGELIYISGELTLPESGRFFFQKQTLPGKQGDFAGVVELPASKTAWRLEPSGPGGKTEPVKHSLDEVICLAMPAADHTGWRLLVQTTHPESGLGPNTNDWDMVVGSDSTNQIVIPLTRANRQSSIA